MNPYDFLSSLTYFFYDHMRIENSTIGNEYMEFIQAIYDYVDEIDGNHKGTERKTETTTSTIINFSTYAFRLQQSLLHSSSLTEFNSLLSLLSLSLLHPSIRSYFYHQFEMKQFNLFQFIYDIIKGKHPALLLLTTTTTMNESIHLTFSSSLFNSLLFLIINFTSIPDSLAWACFSPSPSSSSSSSSSSVGSSSFSFCPVNILVSELGERIREEGELEQRELYGEWLLNIALLDRAKEKERSKKRREKKEEEDGEEEKNQVAEDARFEFLIRELIACLREEQNEEVWRRLLISLLIRIGTEHSAAPLPSVTLPLPPSSDLISTNFDSLPLRCLVPTPRPLDDRLRICLECGVSSAVEHLLVVQSSGVGILAKLILELVKT